MKNQLLITRNETRIITAWSEDGRIRQFQAEKLEQNILGNIYVGKVRNIVKNINAAFVEFQKGEMGYLSLQNLEHPIRTDGYCREDNRVLIGDEIIVQIEKEAVKTKPPTLSGILDLAGKYVVLTAGNNKISISHKIKDKEIRQRLHEMLEKHVSEEYGFIARTNSRNISEAELEKEVSELERKYREIVDFGKHKVQFSCLFQAPPAYLSSIRDAYQDQINEVLTDSEELYGSIKDFIDKNDWNKQMHLSMWDSDHGKMDAVFDISKTLQKALRQRVWLKSGAYLIIQPTEALVSIDVNTGKAISKKKDVQKTFLKVNMEAATEIAVQLRLRNLSGIILIDFIDMNSEESNKKLLEHFRYELAKDPIPAKLVDLTKLGLVEITRKKVRKPLHEQLMDKKTELE